MKLDDINSVGVVGAGLMGHGIAFSFALGGYPTVMSDLSDEILQGAMGKIRSTADVYVEEGLITRQTADEAVGRITPTTDLREVAAASDFVTETIDDNIPVKRRLFADLDGLCPPHTIIASNTGTLVMSDFIGDAKRQDKIVLTHYFSPPAYVPGVELCRGPGTSDETLEVTRGLMWRINHAPIMVLKEVQGYLLNRIHLAMIAEAMQTWAEGVATAEEIERGVRLAFGFRLPNEGPMLRTDYGGGWRRPKKDRMEYAERELVQKAGLEGEEAERVRSHFASGKPWFIDPDKFDEALAVLYRKYARRLRDMYWSTEKQALDPETVS